MTIRLKLIIFTFLIVFIPILFFSFFISTMVVNELYSSMTDKMKNNLAGISLDLERMKEELLFSINRISTNDPLIEKVAAASRGENGGARAEIRSIIENYRNITSFDYLETVDKQGNLLTTSPQMDPNGRIEQYGFSRSLSMEVVLFQLLDDSLVMIASTPLLKDNEMIGVVIGGKKISESYVDILSFRAKGDVNFFFNDTFIIGKSESFALSGSLLLDAKLDDYLSIRDTEIEIDDEKCLLVISPLMLPEDGYFLSVITPLTTIAEKGARLRTGIILSAFCMAFLAALSALIFVNYINKPILELSNATKKISSGDLKTRVRIISRDEIGDLGISFNDMVRQLDMSFEKIESQIEELKTSEKRVRNSEIDFKTVFDYAHDAYFIHDLDGTILDVNQTMLDMYGIDKEQAMEFSIAEDLSSTDNPLDQLPEIWEKVVSGKPQHFEWIAKKPNTGTYFPVDVHLNKIVFAGKEVILATVRDIARRKKAEKGLQTSEQQYRGIFNVSVDAILIFDGDGNIADANPAACTLYGYGHAEMINLSGKDIVSPDYYYLFEKFRTQLKESGRFHAESVDLRKDGSKINIEVRGTTIEYKEEPHLLAMVRDITARKKAEEQLIQSQKMETVGTLAGGLAHDFNNVLVGILGTISMMDHRLRKEGIIEKEKLEEYLQIMKSSGERATAIIQQLLTLSRKQELSLAPTDLNTVIKNIMKIGENSFDKSVKLNPVNLKHPAIVNADSTQIEQVLLNLCVNAVHAMTIMRKEDENWGGELTVTINKTHSDEYLQKVHPEMEEEEYWALSVEDSGVGMDHDTLSKIFDPFFTLKDKGKGTGFGLSIVYNIIKQHQGTIDVYSKIGVGTNFCVYLPVLKEETAHGDEPELTSIHEGEGLILVVDDEEVMRKIAMEILKECGYEVITAENGRKGVEVFEKRKDEITAVLLDMSMPEMSGIEAYHHILEMDPEIRVLITSGSRQDDRIDEVLSSGVKAFIQKPFTLIELSAKMKRVIEGL